MAAATAHDQLLPQPSGGLLPAAGLALLAHAALVLALTLAVQWRASAPEAVTAELWSAVPQVAAPAPPPPSPAPPPPPPKPAPRPEPAPPAPKVEPAPPDPQIAIAQAKAERERVEREKAEKLKKERAAQDKAERDKAEKDRLRKEREAEADRKAKAEAAKREQLAKEQKAEEARLAEQRKKNLERLMGQASASSTGTPGGTAAQTSGPSASYSGKLVAAIKPNIVFTDTISGNPAAEVEVRAGPSGSILSRRLLRSSGNKDWDEAVLRAIDRTGTLPRDTDGRVPSTIIMAFRPQE